MIAAAAYNCMDLEDPELFKEIYDLISPERQAHVDEAKNKKIRCERLGASHLLEKMLWENHVERPYIYHKTSQGKPCFIQPEGIYFSLSHSNYFAACVISDQPCGIDIEKIRPFKLSLVERFFTKSDIGYLKEQPFDLRDKRFTEIWTFKEATCKMMDRPLPQVLQWVDYSIYSDCSKGDLTWTKQGFEFSDFYITICYEHDPYPVKMGLYSPYDGRYY